MTGSSHLRWHWLLAQVLVYLGTASKCDTHDAADAAALAETAGNVFGRGGEYHERPL